MSLEFEFPDTGEGVTEGKFLDWKIDEGNEVEEDQVIAEAETDKAVVEIPAPADGVVKKFKASPGDKVEVGQVILEMETEEEVEQEETSEGREEAEEEEISSGKDEASATDFSSSHSGNVLALPKVRKLAEEKGIELGDIKTGERITEEELIEYAENKKSEASKETSGSGSKVPGESKGLNASPSVRRLAREKGLDISEIDGSGSGGEVLRNDVLEASENENSGNVRSSETHSVETEDGEIERVEMNQVKKTTGSKMEKARFTAPHVTHMDTADVTKLVKLRESVKDDISEHLTYLPFIMKACYVAMKDHPNLNAELDEEKDEIVRKKYYDFNIAVDTDRGLLVPKIKEVDEKNLVELASGISDLVEKAQDGDISPQEMQGGTFSITNIGAIGGEGFTPIINYPQVAILGVGKIQETPEVVNGEIQVRNTLKLSLSYDHRVIDGAEAARFMNSVIENLEKPEEMLMEI
ncbi:MAG: branched-chain alpha-keto acid dehydrogenase subunit E2 [Nanohaloarchaea archaeon SW_7_46_7]|nr:MAG: branched-chain alpha-keto acid dehydrogenase subunit E2 [Nanohaloarchaea archaeon SW_7_46_7]